MPSWLRVAAWVVGVGMTGVGVALGSGVGAVVRVGVMVASGRRVLLVLGAAVVAMGSGKAPGWVAGTSAGVAGDPPQAAITRISRIGIKSRVILTSISYSPGNDLLRNILILS